QLRELVGRRIALVDGGGAHHRVGRGRIAARQHIEERLGRALVERAIGGERVVRDGHARVFDTLGEQRLAQRHQVLHPPVAGAGTVAEQAPQEGAGVHQAAAAAFASPTRRSASSPATRSRSSRYLSSTPSVLFTVSGSSVTRSCATRQFAQSMVSATPGSLKSSVLRSRCTNATTSFDSAALALGALRCRISSSRRASG